MKDLALKPLPGEQIKGPVVFVIMDGIGIGSRDENDGVYMAYTPVLDLLQEEPLQTTLKAHGLAVGLPTDGDMGNSEVGHNALGAGRIIAQGARLINEAIANGTLFSGESWQEVEKRGKEGKTVHFIGLVSDGNVHSNVHYLYTLLDHCAESGIEHVRLHGLLDGRDVGQKSALQYFEPLEQRLTEISATGKDYRFGSGGGRMVTTMDRYGADWNVVENGWKAHVLGEGRQFSSACEAIRTSYEEDPDMTDQYVESFVIAEKGKPVGTIEDGDAVVFFNFRGDRAIELSRAFDEDDFNEFDRKRVPDVYYAGMMQYDGDAKIPENYLINPPVIGRTLGEYLCAAGITSFAIAETQKFGHVTYFWNGNKSGYIDRDLEKYVEIPSDKVTFEKKPWMKAVEVTDSVVEAIESGEYQFIRLNYANGDMVGHTGFEAAVRIAVETVDFCLGRVLKAVKKAGGILAVSADHGNADCLYTEKNGKRVPMVAHTTNPVPFIVKDFGGERRFALTGVSDPGLPNVGATLITLLGYSPPPDYEPSLLEKV
ncbi:2,3-bisphosphoglycerate-independent phosphoglycerate mutase [Desulfopila inferna]|uniref:2,3-bisphosphoglycerate-independent phosphoglycerate mutase n=1 Tax=Desulfopila inferna TaxID=468528 RepID=UPI001964CBEA|nr:2,3-bisphosphoglycerate-independent phosphoglycerate mutase [Desulfopila inferna]MBM9602630.1 2,3-bisphosphoglycerate-independent phosphoglycerate mutase [Desulfopila inferna]